MKVSGTGASAATGSAQRSSRPAAGGFAPQSSEGARETAATGSMASVGALGSLDALLALQETLSPLERRKRAMGRANRLLDALDQIKLTMLEEGADPRAALDRLQSLSRDARDGTDDIGLEALLDQIDTRAAVELAKDEMNRKTGHLAV